MKKRLFFYHKELQCIFLLLRYDNPDYDLETNHYSPICLPLTPVYEYFPRNEYYYCHAPKNLLPSLDHGIQTLLNEQKDNSDITRYLSSFPLTTGHVPATFFPLYKRLIWIRNYEQLEDTLTNKNLYLTHEEREQVKDLYRKLHVIGQPLELLYPSTPF